MDIGYLHEATVKNGEADQYKGKLSVVHHDGSKYYYDLNGVEQEELASFVESAFGNDVAPLEMEIHKTDNLYTVWTGV